MGWFWSDTQRPRATREAPATSHNDNTPPPACPMHAASDSSQTSSAAIPPSCPVRSQPQAGTLSKLNPLNYMPTLSQERAPNQTIALPTSRETSSIPRGDASANWEYPSPQQMYNALLRKGFDDTPANEIESMVAVHNFLNEGAWEEIIGWERRFAGGLRQGWDNCIEGEARFEQKLASENRRPLHEPRLARLQGRPQDYTPKARIMQFLGWVNPSAYSSELPFDRHDWYVQRTTPDGSTKELRYVIDYYSGPPEPTGEPVFYLDVRPAVDSPTAAAERLMRWGGDMWYRASGGTTRLRGVRS